MVSIYKDGSCSMEEQFSENYAFKEIESKWQIRWEKEQPFKAVENPDKPKKYVLDMFPYPSGAGLHVGHMMNYTATDIVSRYWKAKGFEVLHPMGWDSFGLPAEQYALRTKTHPRITTKKNIDCYRQQLKSTGLCYDWSREVATSDPSYYKWTQWIFTKLFEKGLAYESECLVNYCPQLRTVLANEEVVDGKSVEGGYPVIQKPLKQWVLKITEYAQRLLDDLDTLDWPEHLKQQQRHWIGRSEGAVLHFETTSDLILKPFTTRVDTLLGVCFLAVSPEHPELAALVSPEQQSKVSDYVESARKKSDLERTELNKDKTGVFTGSYARCPLTQREIPIYVADYVLAHYGSGCVMGVPGHDVRDYEFAQKYQLNVIETVMTNERFNTLVKNSQNTDKSSNTQSNDKLFEPMLDKGVVYVPLSCKDELSLHGLTSDEATKVLVTWLEEKGKGSKSIHFKLRDWLFSRQRYWGEPIPLLHQKDGTKKALPLEELPLLPPEIEDYQPAEDGRSPLSKVDSWVYQEGGERETNTMPQWAGSCWYYLRFCDPHNTQEGWSVKKENYWMPVDIYVGGVEHAVLHLLYARFWHKVLFDLGLVSTNEPFQMLKNQGMVVARSYRRASGQYVPPQEVKFEEDKAFASDGEPLIELVEKMSKSKLNGVSPDEITESYGADALRLYAMFMGPFDKEKLWSTDSVGGCHRFLKRVWTLTTGDKVSKDTDLGLAQTHLLIKKVEEDLLAWQFNTAIAKMMEWINEITKLESVSFDAMALFTKLLYCFAPHISSEIWEGRYGKKSPLYLEEFPAYSNTLISTLETNNIEMVAQVNGKVRAKETVDKNASKEQLIAIFSKLPQMQKYLEGKEARKVILVPGKLLNFVL